ncbi:MAG TPA: sporulation transcription factor Spo0A [Candidatus Borkfalkia faecigallinarum]|uniref:Stage 0 sporulation protein A homolog n=1 Tax=Candidatus Borkfalkia faecigallinarum TaxID=2838509 RepID=A0A9D1VUF3_9FIRM|nr:sporulation transcription factor Spo0A [Candidatus Borkfalkia faecigallinarum]
MQQKKIVILESNHDTAQAVAESLRGEGFEVCGESDDGSEGVELIERTKPDVVLIGLVLKGLDGFGVMDALRERKIPARAIVTGTFADDEIVARVMAKGARYYLMKPLSPPVVAARAKELAADAGKAAPAPAVREKRSPASLDEKISGIFISIGIPPHIKGYGYLREGIKMAVEEPSIINNVTKQLYPKIAEKFNTTASKVERAIRHSIEVAWNRQRVDAINAVFGVRVYIGTDKPTNSEFIALVADKLILEGLVRY